MPRKLFSAAAALFVGALAWFALVAPDPIPAHFDVVGVVDRWDSNGSLLLIMTAVGAVVVAVFLGAERLTRAIPPELINLPSRRAHAYWTAPERREELNEVLAGFLRVLGAGVLLVLAGITVISAQVGNGGQVDGWVLLAMVGGFWTLFMLAIGYLVWRLRVPPQR